MYTTGIHPEDLFLFAFCSSVCTERVAVKFGIQILMKYTPDRIKILFRRFFREWHIINYIVTAKPVLNVTWI